MKERTGRMQEQWWALAATGLACLLYAGGPVLGQDIDHPPSDEDESPSRFSDEPIPLINLKDFPQRPKPILELGNPFLGSGTLDPGFTLPTGAVFQPSLLVYGSYRTALQTFDDGRRQFTEWANRLDLFANLQLSGTERVLVGIRPFDQDNKFSGYNFHPDENDGWRNEFNGRITTLFFEGDLGEIFPDLDPNDFGTTDIGFSVGRQPILFQEGLLINDSIDSVGITRNNLLPTGGSNTRMTFLYGWNDIHRGDGEEAGGTQLFGVFTESDFPVSTINLDGIYVHDDDGDSDGLFWGASAIQRIGHLNASFRALGSYALDDESTAVGDGYLLFSEISWTPEHSVDLVYVNAFWGIDQFTSAARGPDTGGPLGRTGVLFAAVGLGRYGAPLGNFAENSVGGAIGYQMFFDNTRKQLLFEAGGRTRTDDGDSGALAIGARYQQAMGQHSVLRLDTFGALHDDRDGGWGARVEYLFKF